ncbi:EVE domain-containing protein [Paractinoplanes lichenicola]|uniref:EVE domain-containing protein n=1 Tax=Paractinoplanes lichenicola TaxID=2802976 RepID=A0ABS1W492_9ACTN|nr:EVE domain-containing protein [Actinoplanes lichenicola]MBL7261557.1 EVE domain-containing protein [Actinoplanes lichenicola]
MTAPERFWVSAVSLDHVEAAAAGGFTQADHGANTRLRRLRPGDRIVFYSPRTTMLGGDPVRRFTALATVTGAEPYQAPSGHWRLACEFEPAAAIEVKPLAGELSFISDPAHWGLPFRRGLFTIPEDDFRFIASRMRTG